VIVLLVIVLVLSASSFVVTSAFFAHELGWWPHTKDRRSAADRKFEHRSRYETDVQVTHGFQVVDPYTGILRQLAHADVYSVRDPVRSLENVIARYNEKPTPGRYDDLIHVSNYICNHVRCDESVNGLITRIDELIHTKPPTSTESV
jgi:hypothetical protein